MVSNQKSNVRVAAVQLESKNHALEENLHKANALVEVAVMRGAEIVLLPELMPTGYIMSEAIWDDAETRNGPTIQWLTRTSARHGIWLGTSYLEADAEDFYDSFVLADPKGGVAGTVRKNPPASVEAYFMKEGDGDRYIDTELGRLGVAICGENIFKDSVISLFSASVDMVLQPLSAPTIMKKFPFRQKDVEAVYELVEKGPLELARMLGVPVVLANKCGEWESPLPGISPDQHSRFTGQSVIIDSDGSVKARLGREEEGVIVENVVLDPGRKSTTPPLCNGRWSMPMPWFAFLWPFTQRLGKKSYQTNQRRKKRARSLSMVN